MSKEKVKSLRKILRELKKKKGTIGNLANAIQWVITFGDGTRIQATPENRPLIEEKVRQREAENEAMVEASPIEENVSQATLSNDSIDKQAPPEKIQEDSLKSPVPSPKSEALEQKPRRKLPPWIEEQMWREIGSSEDMQRLFGVNPNTGIIPPGVGKGR
jgi:hypothetical protein